MGVLNSAKDIVTGSARKSLSFADDIKSGASNTISTGIRKGTSPLSVGALGAAGAYTYGQHSDTQSEQAKTARYEAYQERLDEIDQMYQSGAITKEKRNQLRGQTRETYLASSGRENQGISLTEVIAQMGPIQLAVAAGVASIFTYFVLAPLARATADDAPSLEALLG